MKKRMLRLVSCLVLVVFLTISFAQTFVFAFADREPIYLADADIDPESIAPGEVYIATGETELPENGGNFLLKIRRAEGGEGTASVRVTMSDITASYGEDYTVCEWQEKSEVQNEDESSSVLEKIRENADIAEEYNSTDALIDGTAGAIKQEDITESEAEEVVKELYTQMAVEAEEEAAEEPEKDALTLAKEQATGIESDRAPMSGNGVSVNNLMDNMFAPLTENLNSAYLVMEFPEGVTEKYLEIKVKDNSKSDGDKLMNLVLSGESDATQINDKYGAISMMILDDEEKQNAIVSLSEENYSAQDGFIRVELNREGCDNKTVSVKMITESDSAIAGRDFSQVDTTVVFPFGVTKRHVNIPISSDATNEEMSFKIKISDPIGCEISRGEATGIIQPDDTSYQVELEGESNDIHLDGEINLKDFEYDVDSDSIGVVEYTGGRLRLYPEYVWYRLAWGNWVWARLKLTPEGYMTPFYSGIQINWESYHDRSNTWSDTTLYYLGKDSLGANYEERTIGNWENDWKRQSNTYYFGMSYVDKVRIRHNRHHSGASPELNIYSIQPIKKDINVTLEDAAPLQFLDREGNLVDCTAIREDQFAVDATLTHGVKQETLHVGDKITVTARDTADYISTLKEIRLQNQNGYVVLASDGGAAFTKALERDIKCDNAWNNSYAQYMNSTSNRLDVNVKPVFDYLPTSVKVYDNPDGIGQVTVNDGHYEGSGTDSKGNFKTYTFHKGDFIRFKETVNDSYIGTYAAEQIYLTPTGSHQRSGAYDLSTDNDTCVFYNDCTEIEVMPLFKKVENKVSVKVKKIEVSDFDETYGIFAGERTEDNEYYIYTAVKPEDFRGRSYVSLRAKCKNDEYVPIWKTQNSDLKFMQGEYFFYTDATPEKNTVELTFKNAAGSKYTLHAKTYYNDVPEGSSQSVGIRPAEGVSISVDDQHMGVSNGVGEVMCAPFGCADGYAVVYRISHGSEEKFQTAVFHNSDCKSMQYTYEDTQGQSKTVDCLAVELNDIIVSPIDRTVPYMQNVGVVDDAGQSTGQRININNKVSTLTAYIAQDGTSYKDSDGTERTEHIKAVDFVVVDSQTNEAKMKLSGATKDEKGNWSLSYKFIEGLASGYYPADKLYVQITTDRVVGNGKKFVDGQWIDEPRLCQTVYPYVATSVTFDQDVQFDPVPQDFPLSTNVKEDESGVNLNFAPSKEQHWDLPFVKNLVAAFDFGALKLKMLTTPEGLLKIYAGSTVKSIQAINKDEKGIRKPENNPDKQMIVKTLDLMQIYDQAVAFAGGFFSKPEFDVTFGAFILLRPYKTEYEFAGAGGCGGASFAWRGAIYWILGVFPVYLGFDLTVDGLFTFQGVNIARFVPSPDEYIGARNTIRNTMAFDFQASIVGNLDVYGGIGIAKVLGVRGGASFTGYGIWDPTITKEFPSYHNLGAKFTINARFWLDLLLATVNYSVELFHKETGYYEDIKGQSLRSAEEENYEQQTLEFKVRNNDTSRWMGGVPFNSSYRKAESFLLQEGGYDRANPQLLDLGDGKILLLYLDDDGSRNDSNRTALKYSIYQNGIWSDPKLLQDDDMADFQPTVCDAGDDVLITWMSRETSNEMSIDKNFLKEMRICMTSFNKQTLEFSPIETFAEDGYYDYNPIATYDSKTGQAIIYYHKATVTDDYIRTANPVENNAQLMYVIFVKNGNKWEKQDYFEPELANYSQKDSFNEIWQGQRFVNTQNAVAEQTDPNIIDVTSIAQDGYSILAYSVDRDNNMDTDRDRDVYIQIGNTETHKMFEPIRVSNGTESAAAPKLVKSKNRVYLFWYENAKDVAYIDVTDFIQNGMDEDGKIKNDTRLSGDPQPYHFAIGYVFFGTSDLKKQPNLANYVPFTDKDDNIYIAWSEPDENGVGQELFASAAIGGTALWSRGVQLTKTEEYNDEQALVILDDGRLMVVNNQFRLNLEDEKYHPTGIKLVATCYEPSGSVEPGKLQTTAHLPKTGETVDMTVTAINNGIKTANGCEIRVVAESGDKKTTVFTDTTEETIAPSAEHEFRFSYTLPEDIKEAKNTVFRVMTKEKGFAEAAEQTYTPFEFRAEYRIFDSGVMQTTDGVYFNTLVENIGNIDADEESGDKVKVEFDSILYENFDDPGEVFFEEEIGGLEIGETKFFDGMLEISDERFKNGFTFAKVQAYDKEENELAKEEQLDVVLMAPLSIHLPEAKNDSIQIKSGKTMELHPSYTQPEYFKDGTIGYMIEDTSVAEISDNVLKAKQPGTTWMYLHVLPYGTTKIVPITVTSNGGGGGSSGGGSGVAQKNCTVRFETNGGEKLTAMKVEKGTVLTELPTPHKEGFEFYGWFTDKALTEEFYAGTAITEDTTLYAKWGEPRPWQNPFADVKESDWFYDAVKFVGEKGLMTGTSETTFEPLSEVTRGMFATVLWRMDDCMQANLIMPFTDVPEDEYYAEAVRWAAAKKIVEGTSETTFEPDAKITREEMATMLYRYIRSHGGGFTGDWAFLLDFKDADKVSDWAYEAMCYLTMPSVGLMQGMEDGTLAPEANTNRAELATVLQRYCTMDENK